MWFEKIHEVNVETYREVGSVSWPWNENLVRQAVIPGTLQVCIVLEIGIRASCLAGELGTPFGSLFPLSLKDLKKIVSWCSR